MKKIVRYLLLIIGIFAVNLINVDAKDIIIDKIADVEPNSYIIGKHVFTSDSELTMEKIMYAAKTINSDKLEDMKIYYKDPWGEWINAVSGKNLSQNEIDEIPKGLSYIDLVKRPIELSLDFGNYSMQYQLNYVNGKYKYYERIQELSTGEYYAIQLYKEDKNGIYNVVKEEIVEGKTGAFRFEFEMERGESANYYFRAYMKKGEDMYFTRPTKFSLTAPEEDLDNLVVADPMVSVVLLDANGIETDVRDKNVVKTVRLKFSENELYDGISMPSGGDVEDFGKYYDLVSNEQPYYSLYNDYFGSGLYIKSYVYLSNGLKYYGDSYLVE